MNHFILILHSHMPYVRKKGVWPVGEDWLFQAMAHCYLPLLEMLSRLKERGIAPALTLTVTPILAEQLRDSHIKNGFISFASKRTALAEEDYSAFDIEGGRSRKAQAHWYREHYSRILDRFQECDGDVIGELKALDRAGVIELWASAATHAYLPLLPDVSAVKAQVDLGIKVHEMLFGERPIGFWLPECGYRRGIEAMLEKGGIKYFSSDPRGLIDGSGSGAYLVGKSNLVTLVRSSIAHRNVWDEFNGYPNDSDYLDTTKYRNESGLFYWRVTGPDVPIEEKDIYSEEEAGSKVSAHARHFIEEIVRECEEHGRGECLVVASFDTELFGHGWHEGIDWLEQMLSGMHRDPRLQLEVPRTYLQANPAMTTTAIQEGSWGTGGDHSTWLNEDTKDMYGDLLAAQDSWAKIRPLGNEPLPEPAMRALRQAARELLLLQSSDWAYMVAKARASKYARLRFESHKERYYRLLEVLRGEDVSPETISWLEDVEEQDKIFTDIDPLGFL